MEKFLLKAERLLQDYPVTTRTKILALIKADLENRPELTSASLKSVKNAINQKLNELGLPPLKRSSSIIKNISLGCMGIILLVSVIGFFALKKITPLMHIDEEKGRVILLGGLIDLNMESGTYQIDYQYSSQLNTLDSFEGEQDTSNIDFIRLDFSKTASSIYFGPINKILWNCKILNNEISTPIIKNKQFKLDFSQFEASECKINLPKNIRTLIKLNIGHLKLTDPHSDLELSMEKGSIDLYSQHNMTYWIKPNSQVVLKGLSQDPTLANVIELNIKLNQGIIWQK